ncbi:tRNA (uracil-5-)-methyltransferase-like protein A [Sciurus carolinensis]|uniref:tRNA (Uracil-5-)-methyltransferase-like protein A n=1 Tax=Sciurus carolinensis TaxID=30640 RepID=A0AA41T8X0_SCICA|nr:tRNA (uracil-5-)-methyltransferase-like protein A [Sciurus carolinensis]
MECEQGLRRLAKEIGSISYTLLPWLPTQRHKDNKDCCLLEGFRWSPDERRKPSRKSSDPLHTQHMNLRHRQATGSHHGRAMAITYLQPQKLSLEEVPKLKTCLLQYFMEGLGSASGVICLYLVKEGQ